MFCDLVGSTALSEQLDPEELLDIVRAYQEMCAAVITRFEGHIAKYLGDGMLVYFGYPLAHEDDAQRAVHTGLNILAELPELNARLRQIGAKHTPPLQARIGIHTGLVVVGEMGGGDYREQMAIVGDTPNIAARMQEIAQPDSVVISAATHRIVQGYFECFDLGARALKGISTPVQVYRVLRESEIHRRLELSAAMGLTPLVGREREVEFVRGRWEQVKDGFGQVVLLSGEPGIGKSRLVHEVKEHTAQESHALVECYCSPNTRTAVSIP
jgi:class 3 adenylate cyclase